jgi:hypothetical protein
MILYTLFVVIETLPGLALSIRKIVSEESVLVTVTAIGIAENKRRI